MTRAEAFKILTSDTERVGRIGKTRVEVWPADIKVNIECNDDLDIEWIQDFNCPCGIFQGYSLRDVKLI